MYTIIGQTDVAILHQRIPYGISSICEQNSRRRYKSISIRAFNTYFTVGQMEIQNEMKAIRFCSKVTKQNSFTRNTKKLA